MQIQVSSLLMSVYLLFRFLCTEDTPLIKKKKKSVHLITFKHLPSKTGYLTSSITVNMFLSFAWPDSTDDNLFLFSMAAQKILC